MPTHTRRKTDTSKEEPLIEIPIGEHLLAREVEEQTTFTINEGSDQEAGLIEMYTVEAAFRNIFPGLARRHAAPHKITIKGSPGILRQAPAIAQMAIHGTLWPVAS